MHDLVKSSKLTEVLNTLLNKLDWSVDFKVEGEVTETWP